MVERDARHQRTVEQTLSKMKYAMGDVERANAKVRRVVADARAAGATWAEVGAAVGMTGQGAQKRFGSRSDRQQAHKAREDHQRAVAALKTCPKCSERFPTLKAAQAHVQTCDVWPDGTTQAVIE